MMLSDNEMTSGSESTSSVVTKDSVGLKVPSSLATAVQPLSLSLHGLKASSYVEPGSMYSNSEPPMDGDEIGIHASDFESDPLSCLLRRTMSLLRNSWRGLSSPGLRVDDGLGLHQQGFAWPSSKNICRFCSVAGSRHDCLPLITLDVMFVAVGKVAGRTVAGLGDCCVTNGRKDVLGGLINDTELVGSVLRTVCVRGSRALPDDAGCAQNVSGSLVGEYVDDAALESAEPAASIGKAGREGVILKGLDPGLEDRTFGVKDPCTRRPSFGHAVGVPCKSGPGRGVFSGRVGGKKSLAFNVGVGHTAEGAAF